MPFIQQGTDLGRTAVIIGDSTYNLASGVGSVAIAGNGTDTFTKSEARTDYSIAVLGGTVSKASTSDTYARSMSVGVQSVVKDSNDSLALGSSSRVHKGLKSFAAAGGYVGDSSATNTSNYAIAIGTSTKALGNNSQVIGGSGTSFNGGLTIGSKESYSTTNSGMPSITIGSKGVYNSGEITSASIDSYNNGYFGTMVASKAAYLGGNDNMIFAPNYFNTFIMRLTGEANATTYTYGYGSSGDFMHEYNYLFGGTNEDYVKHLLSYYGQIYIRSKMYDTAPANYTAYPDYAYK